MSHAIEVTLTSWEHAQSRSIMFVPSVHGTHSLRHSAPQHMASGRAHVQSKRPRWDYIPELPSGTSSFPQSSSWEPLRGSGDLMSMDQQHCTNIHGPNGQVFIEQFLCIKLSLGTAGRRTEKE